MTNDQNTTDAPEAIPTTIPEGAYALVFTDNNVEIVTPSADGDSVTDGHLLLLGLVMLLKQPDWASELIKSTADTMNAAVAEAKI